MPQGKGVNVKSHPVSLTLAVALAVAFLAAGCGQQAGSSGAGKLTVVTTSSVFADMIGNVGGDRVTVSALVPHSADVHTFQPSPADVRAVAGARLLVMNGLGLDDWLRNTIVNASAAGTPLVELGPGLQGVELLPGDQPGTQNPHLWMSVPYAKGYVGEMEDALVRADPSNADSYHQGANAYRARLDALDQKIRNDINTIPTANRRLVTFHDAFPYFAREYGIQIVGVAVEAPGQDPSASEIAALIEAIKAAHVKAIFSEEQFPTQLVDQLAASTGAKVVAQLYDDSLGDPPVTSYEALITWDVDQLVRALA
jgi:ABC-type Zn uptake system ZnuABC Zn-binding protein ZnuA